ncbi:MAG: ABC transporter permease [Kiritimatiellia bacterium]
MPANPRRSEWLLTAPSLGWLLLLFLIPTLLVFTIAFRPADVFGGIGEGWTLETFRRLTNPSYPAIIWRTIRLSVVTTLVCLLLAVPVGYTIARARASLRSTLLMLVIIPFWTNFLVRIFAWKVVLHPEGLLKNFLVHLGLAGPDTSLLYNEGAVLLVLIYTYLPFAILPIYAAAEKFDFQLVEASMDLGCSRLRALWNTFLPGIGRGLLTAGLVVFIPALGSYVIPDIMGGPSGEMIGNKIAQRVFIDRNLPHASGLAALLTLAVLLPMLWVLIQQGREHSRGQEGRG